MTVEKAAILAQRLASLLPARQIAFGAMLFGLPALGVVTAFGIAPGTAVEAFERTAVTVDLPLPVPEPVADMPAARFLNQERVQRGDTVAALFSRLGVSDGAGLAFLRADAVGRQIFRQLWLVELAPITDPEFVARAICGVLDITLPGNASPLTVLTEYLHAKKLLLVVDNCEHLIETCAQLCDSLLHACPKLRILASSREALGIDGESSYRVPSLSLPDPKSGLAAIEGTESVKLFMDRATAVLPEFELNETNASSIAQICKRLDGIPLAIELAASRVKLLNGSRSLHASTMHSACSRVAAALPCRARRPCAR